MKTLTVKQPWASLICSGMKDIENRTWKTKFRGRVLIHAGAKEDNLFLSLDESLFTQEQWKALPEYVARNIINKFPIISAIIGSVEIVDCVINHPSIWAEKSTWYGQNISASHGTRHRHKEDDPTYNWVLANPILFDKTIPAKGKLSFWEFDETLIPK